MPRRPQDGRRPCRAGRAVHADAGEPGRQPDARVIGSILDYRYAPDDPEAVIELLAEPGTRIISLTITEGGYNIDGVDADGVSVFGLVAEAISRRRERGIASPTIVSCDNVEGNGDIARHAFTTYAERLHPAWRNGCANTPGSPTRWSTASPRSPRRRLSRRWTPSSASGPLARGGRTVHVVGARRRLLRRPTPVGRRRRAARRRRHAVRNDEVAAAQRQPSEPVLLRLPGRLPAGARAAGDPLFAEFLTSTWIRKPRRH